MTALTFTFDCRDAVAQARFWALALDYESSPPPEGWSTWEDFLRDQDVPQGEWDDGASIRPRPGSPGPRLSFLAVPEPKTAKNRLHPDLQVSGGRHVPAAERERSIRHTVERLVDAGATVAVEAAQAGRLDHVVMLDPEGNEFCVV